MKKFYNLGAWCHVLCIAHGCAYFNSRNSTRGFRSPFYIKIIVLNHYGNDTNIFQNSILSFESSVDPDQSPYFVFIKPKMCID